MKTGRLIVLVGIVLFTIPTLFLIVKGYDKPLPAGFTAEDAATANQAGIKDEGEWLVTRVLTNTQSISLVRVMSPKATNDDEYARYAVTTDPSVTNGTLVKLMQIWHAHSSTTAYEAGHNDQSVLAIRLNK